VFRVGCGEGVEEGVVNTVYPTAAIGEPVEEEGSMFAVRDDAVHGFGLSAPQLLYSFVEISSMFAVYGRGAENFARHHVAFGDENVFSRKC